MNRSCQKLHRFSQVVFFKTTGYISSIEICSSYKLSLKFLLLLSSTCNVKCHILHARTFRLDVQTQFSLKLLAKFLNRSICPCVDQVNGKILYWVGSLGNPCMKIAWKWKRKRFFLDFLSNVSEKNHVHSFRLCLSRQNFAFRCIFKKDFGFRSLHHNFGLIGQNSQNFGKRPTLLHNQTVFLPNCPVDFFHQSLNWQLSSCRTLLLETFLVWLLSTEKWWIETLKRTYSNFFPEFKLKFL